MFAPFIRSTHIYILFIQINGIGARRRRDRHDVRKHDFLQTKTYIKIAKLFLRLYDIVRHVYLGGSTRRCLSGKQKKLSDSFQPSLILEVICHRLNILGTLYR